MKRTSQCLIASDTKLAIAFEPMFLVVDAGKEIPDSPEVRKSQFLDVAEEAPVRPLCR